MAYQKTPQEQLLIVRQTSLQRAVELYLNDSLKGKTIEEVAENFVSWVYANIGLPVGHAATEDQVQAMIIEQNVLTRMVEMVIAGAIEPEEIFSTAKPLLTYIYTGNNNATN